MTRPIGAWWNRRSLTLRLTIVATVVLAIGLMSGIAGLATLFYHSRIEAVDSNVRSAAASVVSLVSSGQLPDPLPVPAGQPVFAQVLSANGTVRAASPSASRVVPILPISVLRSRGGSEPFTTTETTLGEDPMRVVVTATRLAGHPVLVVTAVPLADVTAILDSLLRMLVIAVPVILLASATATWLAVSSALHPVDQLRAAADEVAQVPGREPAQLPVPESGDELARLADTLNQMLRRLHQAAERQRTFVADAAHELRSPIASIRTQLEVALETPTDAADWPRVAAEALRDVERTGRLADDMLLLAKLDSGVATRRERVDMTSLLGLRGSALWVDGDARALRRAIDNLLSNAHRHAHSTVEVDVHREGLNVVVTVDDDGAGLTADDRERVFERWMRLDDARARDEGGAGLGLAITRAVARAHGGDVTLEDSPLGGVRARLRLPARPGSMTSQR
jgi:signal transduction histidine kinase